MCKILENIQSSITWYKIMHYSKFLTLFQAFYNILPNEGLDPPGRPNFQPIYDEQDLVRSRHNDKSV